MIPGLLTKRLPPKIFDGHVNDMDIIAINKL